mmetsp:Transcript_47852/g.133256  ORF Transcript_47852/g.133256 Transcript_47852/m.133256 type:complete len:261 (+) Transcript_47852:358-1140(+)
MPSLEARLRPPPGGPGAQGPEQGGEEVAPQSVRLPLLHGRLLAPPAEGLQGARAAEHLRLAGERAEGEARHDQHPLREHPRQGSVVRERVRVPRLQALHGLGEGLLAQELAERHERHGGGGAHLRRLQGAHGDRGDAGGGVPVRLPAAAARPAAVRQRRLRSTPGLGAREDGRPLIQRAPAATDVEQAAPHVVPECAVPRPTGQDDPLGLRAPQLDGHPVDLPDDARGVVPSAPLRLLRLQQEDAHLHPEGGGVQVVVLP